MKGVLVILDGIGDSALNNKTPLESAKTPNLDFLASKSKIDYCYTVKKDYAPESNEGVLSLLGYDSFGIKRGTLEALGVGINVKNGDLAFRCNFATIDNLKDLRVIDRRAGRTLTTKEAKILASSINKELKLPFPFVFVPGIQHRAALVIKGGFSDNITSAEPKNNKLIFSSPLDDEDDSKLSSNLVNLFVRKSFEILNAHPINKIRLKKGLFPANVLLCRGAGSEKPKLKKLKGKWLALGYMPLEKGIAKALGMHLYTFKYPKLKNMDVYENLYAGLKKAIKKAIKMLKRNRKKYDYFYIHFKECDIPGHDNKPLDKIKMIEMIDQRFFSFLRKFIKGSKLVITADHATPCKIKAHSADPVPVLTYPSKNKKEQRFTETQALQGKKFTGHNLLKNTLYKKDS